MSLPLPCGRVHACLALVWVLRCVCDLSFALAVGTFAWAVAWAVGAILLDICWEDGEALVEIAAWLLLALSTGWWRLTGWWAATRRVYSRCRSWWHATARLSAVGSTAVGVFVCVSAPQLILQLIACTLYVLWGCQPTSCMSRRARRSLICRLKAMLLFAALLSLLPFLLLRPAVQHTTATGTDSSAQPDPFFVYIETLTGSMTLQLSASDLVSRVKHAVCTSTCERLEYMGQPLADCCTLAAYGIQAGSTLKVKGGLRGGGPRAVPSTSQQCGSRSASPQCLTESDVDDDQQSQYSGSIDGGGSDVLCSDSEADCGTDTGHDGDEEGELAEGAIVDYNAGDHWVQVPCAHACSYWAWLPNSRLDVPACDAGSSCDGGSS